MSRDNDAYTDLVLDELLANHSLLLPEQRLSEGQTSKAALEEELRRMQAELYRMQQTVEHLQEENARLRGSGRQGIEKQLVPLENLKQSYQTDLWLQEANTLVCRDSNGMLTQSLLYNLPAVIACYKQHEEHIKIAFDNAIRGRAYFEPFLLLIYHLAVLVKNDEVRADLINHFSTVPEDDLRVQSWGGSSLSELFDELTPLLKDLRVLERQGAVQKNSERDSRLLQAYLAVYCIAEKLNLLPSLLFGEGGGVVWQQLFKTHSELLPASLWVEVDSFSDAFSKTLSNSTQGDKSGPRVANRGLIFAFLFDWGDISERSTKVIAALFAYHRHHPVCSQDTLVRGRWDVTRAGKRTHGEIDDARDELVDWSAEGFFPLFPSAANKRQRKGKEPQADVRRSEFDLSSYYLERSGWLAKGNKLIKMNAYGEIRGSLFESLDAIIRLYMANKTAIKQALDSAVKGRKYFEPFTLLIYSIGLLMHCEEAVNELDAHFQEQEERSLKEPLSKLSDLKECEAMTNIMSSPKLIMMLSAAICSREKTPSNKSEFYGNFFESCAFFTYSTGRYGDFFPHFLRTRNLGKNPAGEAVKLANRSLILRCFFGSALYLPPDAKQEVVHYYTSYPRVGAPTGPGCV